MKKEELMKKLEEMNEYEDLHIFDKGNCIDVEIYDCMSLDENWNENMRDVTLDECELYEFLEKSSKSYEKKDYCYEKYEFDDFYVLLSKASYDI